MSQGHLGFGSPVGVFASMPVGNAPAPPPPSETRFGNRFPAGGDFRSTQGHRGRWYFVVFIVDKGAGVSVEEPARTNPAVFSEAPTPSLEVLEVPQPSGQHERTEHERLVQKSDSSKLSEEEQKRENQNKNQKERKPKKMSTEPLLSSEKSWFTKLYEQAVRTKSVEMIEEETRMYSEDLHSDHKKVLKRTLNWVDLITVGVGGSVGAGIFVLLGKSARDVAGPAVTVSLIMAGMSCVFSAMCYSEMASRVPVSGSAYTFAYVALGEMVAWIIGWNLTLEYGIAAAAIARGWSSYVVEILGIWFTVPAWVNSLECGPFVLSPLSCVIIFAVTAILCVGVKQGSAVNNVITAVNVGLLLFISVVGACYIDVKNWANFMPFGARGVLEGASRVFFSFIGFDAVACLAEEVKRPKRDIPLGIIGSLAVVSFLYVAIALVLTGMVPYYEIDVNTPLSAVFKAHGIQWAEVVVSVFTIAVMTATALCAFLGQPRIYLAMARDGLFFSLFSDVNRRTNSPVKGTMVTGLLVSTLAFCFDADALSTMINIGTLMAFLVVCATIIILRYRDPANANRSSVFNTIWGACIIVITLLSAAISLCVHFRVHWSFTLVFGLLWFLPFVLLCTQPQQAPPATFACPFVPLTPCLGIFCNTFMMFQLPYDAWLRVGVWLIIGLIIYGVYGIRHSKLANPNHFKMVTGVDEDDEGLEGPPQIVSTGEASPPRVTGHSASGLREIQRQVSI